MVIKRQCITVMNNLPHYLLCDAAHTQVKSGQNYIKIIISFSFNFIMFSRTNNKLSDDFERYIWYK